MRVGGKSLAEVKIQRGIFQGVALIPLLFVIVIMPLNHILRKSGGGYKLTKAEEKINHLKYMDDIKKKKKKNWKLIQRVRIYSQEIGMEFGIEKCAMPVMRSRKGHVTEGIELTSPPPK